MKKLTYAILSLMVILGLLFALVGCGSDGNNTTDTGVDEGVDTGIVKPQERLKVSTTTSLYDTGLWNMLEDLFEEQYSIRLDILYAGTGIALEYGQRGDVDALAVHDKAREEQFIADGYGMERVPFAYNYFVIVGPEGDPAGLKGLSPEEALRKLYEEKAAPFISRGDDSGTHSKEKAVWKSAGLEYEAVTASGDWYVEAGRGMGPTLLMANEMQGYTLSDMGTFLAFQGDTGLVPVIDKGSILLNVYSVIAVDPDTIEGANYEAAEKLIDFLVSEDVQRIIGEYGVADYGSPLFFPCAGNEPTE